MAVRKQGVTAICLPKHADPLERRAAQELCKYMTQMIGGECSIRRGWSLVDSDAAFVVCEASKVVSICPSMDLSASLMKDVPRHRDGYLVRSVVMDGCTCVYLIGRTALACLYACYDYLANTCGCGFFQDGEFVPRLDSLPVSGIAVSEQPRFENRMHFCWNAHRAIKKYHSFWWTLDDWKRECDWMVKNRLNLIRLDMAYFSRFAGDTFEQAFPEIGKEPGGVLYPHYAGWVTGWGWPPAYRRKLTQRIFEYGRSLGIRFIYTISYACVPSRFRDAHPEYEYLPANQYGESREISPYDPNAYKVERRPLAKIVEQFGTDHLYMCTPYAEIDVGGGSMKRNLEMRIEAGKGVLKLIRDVDPDGIWVTDTWDMIDSKKRWNPQRVKKYFDSFPKSHLLLYETAADADPLHNKYGQWHGKEWAFGVLHSFAGKDTLHGNATQLIRLVKNVAQSSTCTGLFMVPEMTHANTMFWDLVAHLAWQPDGFRLDAYLKTFVERRYGRTLSVPMHEAWRKIVKAVYTEPVRNIWDYVYGEHPWFQWPSDCPLYDGRKRKLNRRLRQFRRELPLLQDALSILMRHRKQLADHPLYVEDVVVLFRDIAGKRFNQASAAAFEAFRKGQVDAFDEHRREAMSILRAIESVLALCSSYSINRTIKEACTVRGHNPHLPEMIRQACLNVGYVNQDVYEQFQGQYVPKTKACFALLARKLKTGGRGLKNDELKVSFDRIMESYRDNGWQPKENKTGDPVAVVARHFRRIRMTDDSSEG